MKYAISIQIQDEKNVFDEMQNMLNGIHRDNTRILTQQMPGYMRGLVTDELLKVLDETEGVGAVTINKVKNAIENSKTRLEDVIKNKTRNKDRNLDKLLIASG